MFEITLNEDISSYNIKTFENGQEEQRVEHVYKTSVKVVKANHMDELKGAFIRLKYTIDEEFSFIYKDEEDPNRVAYRNYVEDVKQFVDSSVNNK